MQASPPRNTLGACGDTVVSNPLAEAPIRHSEWKEHEPVFTLAGADLNGLEPFWAFCTELRQALFRERRPGCLAFAGDRAAINASIHGPINGAMTASAKPLHSA